MSYPKKKANLDYYFPKKHFYSNNGTIFMVRMVEPPVAVRVDYLFLIEKANKKKKYSHYFYDQISLLQNKF